MDSEAGKGGNAGTNGKASVAGGVGIVRWSRKLTTATIAMARNPSVVGSSPTWGTDPLTRLPRGVPLLRKTRLSCGKGMSHPVKSKRRRRKMPLPRGNASAHGQSSRNLPWPTASPSPGAIASVPGLEFVLPQRALAISGDYRFSSRSACFCGSSRTRQLPGTIASVPGAIASLSTGPPQNRQEANEIRAVYRRLCVNPHTKAQAC